MFQNKNKTLRQMFSSAGLTRSVGAHDGLGAKLIGESGFDLCGHQVSKFRLLMAYLMQIF